MALQIFQTTVAMEENAGIAIFCPESKNRSAQKMKISVFHTFFDSLLLLIFPEKCRGCGKKGKPLCNECFKKIPPLNVSSIRGKEPIIKIFSYTSYSGLAKKIITDFKFKGIKSLAEPLAQMAIEVLPKPLRPPGNTLLLPIPLHHLRYKERRFNQSELIAKQISEQTSIPVCNNSIIRTGNTSFMHKLTTKQRRKNIKGAFKAVQPELLKDKTIIIIDDIFTTGATVEEFAKVIKETGAAQIYALTPARAARD